jgi:Divergent InlB B-repeat domain
MKRALVLIAGLTAASVAASASARMMHYQVTVTVTGPGHVTAPAPDPTSGSIDCPTLCSALVKQRTTLVLTATPASGATFGGWGGDCASAGTSTTCSLTMTGEGSNGSKSITAGFGSPPPVAARVALIVKKAGTGAGFVGGGGLDCGHVCSKRLVRGTKLVLVAVPTGRAVFLGWGGPCSGRGRCAVVVQARTVVTATFVDPRRPYIATFSGSAARGKIASLQFRVWVARGRSREALTVAHGKAMLARLKVALRHPTYAALYAFRWRVPTTAPRGKAAFCAVAFDEAGKRSPQSCSSLRIT